MGSPDPFHIWHCNLPVHFVRTAVPNAIQTFKTLDESIRQRIQAFNKIQFLSETQQTSVNDPIAPW